MKMPDSVRPAHSLAFPTDTRPTRADDGGDCSPEAFGAGAAFAG